jgi:predicted aconitase with swiveling domain
MKEVILRGHRVVKGKAEGEALVCGSPISFYGEINPESGLIVEKGHELEGQSVAGKVFIFPVGKGSTGGVFTLYELACNGRAPKAILNARADSIVAMAAMMSKIPMLDKLDPNPMDLVQTGDHVEVDADQGIVRVRKLIESSG